MGSSGRDLKCHHWHEQVDCSVCLQGSHLRAKVGNYEDFDP